MPGYPGTKGSELRDPINFDTSEWSRSTIQGTNISLFEGTFEDDSPFHKVRYVSFLDITRKKWSKSQSMSCSHENPPKEEVPVHCACVLLKHIEAPLPQRKTYRSLKQPNCRNRMNDWRDMTDDHSGLNLKFHSAQRRWQPRHTSHLSRSPCFELRDHSLIAPYIVPACISRCNFMWCSNFICRSSSSFWSCW